MKKNVTIFSTKTLTDKGCLFDGCTPKVYSEAIFDYFMPSIPDLVRMCIKCELMEEVKKTLLNFNSKTPLPKDSEKIDKGRPVDKVYSIHIEFETNNAGIETNMFDELCNRIDSWDLKLQLINLLFEKKCEDILTIKNRATLYQLDNLDVYAIKCLDNNEIKSNEWISSLIQFAKSLASQNDQLEINLVLHDKDLGSKYDKPNPPTIITEDKIKEEFKDVPILQTLQKDDLCRIAFFQHTTNAFVDILNESFNKKRKIHEEVISACKRYSCGLDYLMNMSEYNIQNTGKDIYNSQCDEYNKVALDGLAIQDDFQSYELLKTINENTKKIVKHLTE